MGPVRFQAGGRSGRPNLALFFNSFYIVVYFVTDACSLGCVCFSFSVLSQEIGWEEHLCVRWDVKPLLYQSINQLFSH